jgi:hypothetical protein
MILRAVCVAAALVGCYDPDLRDCTVTCKLASDCAGDQTCTSGLCVDETTKSCAAPDRPDAGAKVDAMMSPPPPAMVMLHVTVNGKGTVTLDGNHLTMCVAIGDSADCMWNVTTAAAHVLDEAPQVGRSFATWSGACSGSATTCTLQLTADATVGAMFNN